MNMEILVISCIIGMMIGAVLLGIMNIYTANLVKKLNKENKELRKSIELLGNWHIESKNWPTTR